MRTNRVVESRPAIDLATPGPSQGNGYYPCMKRKRDDADGIRISVLSDEMLRRSDYRDLHAPAVLFTGGTTPRNKVAFKFELPVAARFFANGLRAVAAELGVCPLQLLKESA